MAALGLASSQNAVTVDCNYLIFGGEYVCSLNGIEVTDPTAEVTFGGIHLDGRTELEVDVVWILDSNTPFMIQSIFTTFPNINELTIEESNLQSISIPANSSVEWLFLYGNNISRLEAGTLQAPILFYFEAIDNGILAIDGGFFDQAPDTRYIDLSVNNITELAAGSFAPGAVLIDLYRNGLAVIEEGLFVNNSILVALYLDRNVIVDIHPSFITGLPANLQYVAMAQNECFSGNLEVTSDGLRMMANNALNQCFRNFVSKS